MTTTNTNYCALYMGTSGTKVSSSKIERSKELLMAEIQKRLINDGPDVWKIVEFRRDKGLSALAPRSDFKNLLQQVEQGYVNCIVVPEMDLLLRNWQDQQEFLNLAIRYKFRLISVMENIDIESTDHLGLIAATVIADTQRAERQRSSLRAKESWKRRRNSQEAWKTKEL